MNDGRSRSTPDQAARLRQMARGHRRSALTLAVTSGKGGVGKSNLAVNLSICLASRGARVTLVDVDMGLANADLLMDLHPAHTLSHVLADVRTLEEVAVVGPCGIRFIPGASGLHELADLSEFERQSLVAKLHSLENSTDILVFDCGAGIGRNVLSFALAADRVIVVTTPEPTAMTDAYAVIKALSREGCEGRMGLFVNMAESRLAAVETHRRVATVALRFLNYSVAEDGYMLQDRAVELAVQERCPFVVRYPASNAASCVAALAGEILRTVSGQQRRGGFFSRVAGLFA